LEGIKNGAKDQEDKAVSEYIRATLKSDEKQKPKPKKKAQRQGSVLHRGKGVDEPKESPERKKRRPVHKLPTATTPQKSKVRPEPFSVIPRSIPSHPPSSFLYAAATIEPPCLGCLVCLSAAPGMEGRNQSSHLAYRAFTRHYYYLLVGKRKRERERRM
jgi:hypothetical protein